MKVVVAAAALLCAALLPEGAHALAGQHAIVAKSFTKTAKLPLMRRTLMTAEDLAADGGAEAEEKRVVVELIAQGSGLTASPQQQQQQQRKRYSTAASGSGISPPTFAQRARGPFVGITFLATAVVAGWQSKRIYKQRQEGLLAEFAVTMMDRLGDIREMDETFKSYRKELGPGSYKSQMFVRFAVALAKGPPISVNGIKQLKNVVGIMSLTQEAVAELYVTCAEELKDSPSAFGKLLFLAERATPEAAATANMRSRIPSWSPETIDLLQKAMLENLYKEMCNAVPADSAPPQGAEILGISSTDAKRMFEEAQTAKAAAARMAEAEGEKRSEQKRLQDALKAASAVSTSKVKKVPGATHEFECGDCGYTMFPAAGREGKFFGDDFKCPECGAPKDKFRDKGPAA